MPVQIKSVQIKSINLSRMNNGAHFFYVSEIKTRVEADTKVATKCGARFDRFKAAVAQEDLDLKISQKSQFTDEIIAADLERGEFYMAFKKTVRNFLDIPIAGMAQAAKVLWQLIIDYGIEPRMQLERETGMLMNFVSDLEEKYAEQVAALALTQVVEQLKEANNRVATYIASRAEERMEIAVGALRASRAVTDDTYYDLIMTINAYAWIEGDADYADIINFINSRIKTYKREVLGQTGGTPDDAPAEGGDSTTPDETPDEGGNTPSEGETPEGGDTSGSGTEEGGETPPPSSGDDDEEVVG